MDNIPLLYLQQDPRKLVAWVILASVVMGVQLAVFQTSLLVGHYGSWSLEPAPHTWYEEPDADLRVLKVGTQSISVLGTFYTLYEVWVVKLFIEELEDDTLYRDSSDDRIAHHHSGPLRLSNHHHRHHTRRP